MVGRACLPGVDEDVIRVIRPVQDADRNDIVQPVIIRVSRLEEYAQDDPTI